MQQTQQDPNQSSQPPIRRRWFNTMTNILIFVGITIIGAIITDLFHLLLELAVPFIKIVWLLWVLAGAVALILILLSVYSIRSFVQKKRLRAELKICNQRLAQAQCDCRHRDEAIVQRDEALAQRDEALTKLQTAQNELTKEQRSHTTMRNVVKVDSSIIEQLKYLLPQGGDDEART